MPKPRPIGLPSRQQILDFITTAPGLSGKREIARAFGLKGQEKIQLKALLKDMADEGLIDGNRAAFHRMGGVAKVTVLRVIEIEDTLAAEALAALTPEQQQTVEKDADGELAPFRSRMSAEAYAQSRRAAIHRLVRQHFGLPSL